MVEHNFLKNGQEFVIKGTMPLEQKYQKLLIEDPLPFLVRPEYQRVGEVHLLVYNLQRATSLEDCLQRERESINLEDLLTIVEKIYYLKDEYFFKLNSFVVSSDLILYDFQKGLIGLVYCPYFKGDTMLDILALGATILSETPWYASYLERLEKYVPYVSIENYLGLLRLLKEEYFFETNKLEEDEPLPLHPIDFPELLDQQQKTTYHYWKTFFKIVEEKKLLFYLIPVLIGIGFLIGLLL